MFPARAKKVAHRRRLELPLLLVCCASTFLAGLFAPSALHSARREGMMEAAGVPHGETGEPRAVSIPYQVLSWKPRALYFPNFASANQCEQIIEMAKGHLTPSLLARQSGDTDEKNTKGIRTSSGTFINSSNDSTGILREIEQKMARVTMIPTENGEDFNILRYEIGQRYASHYDAFDPAMYGAIRGQRVASFLLYLSNVKAGGETVFPFENGSNMNSSYDYESCIGLKVEPRKGDALLFYSVLVNGTIDQVSLHASCPVIEGEKWVATKWLADESLDYITN